MSAAQDIYYYTVYQTTNLVNGHFYIGKHTTTDPYDDYIGSGELLNRAIEKHGRNNFKKYILFYCDSNEEAYKIENLIVTKDVVAMNECYNINIGGYAPPIKEKEEHWSRTDPKKWQRKCKFINDNPMKSDEMKRYFSKITKENINSGKVKTFPNTIDLKKKSEIMKNDNPMFNEEIKKKFRKPKEIVKCPYCLKEGGKASHVKVSL